MRRKATAIRLKGTAILGSGATSNVILRTFKDEDIVLFSMVYGDFLDTKLSLALTADVASRWEKTKLDNTILNPYTFSPVVDVDEYELTEAIQTEMEVFQDGIDYKIFKRENTKYIVYTHDDYYFSVEPINPELIKQLIQSILLDHINFKKNEVDISDVPDKLVKLIYQSKKIRICSNPKWNYLIIRQEQSVWSLINGLREWLFPHSFCAVIIKDGKANFTTSFSSTLSKIR